MLWKQTGRGGVLKKINRLASADMSAALSKLFGKSVEAEIIEVEVVKSAVPLPIFKIDAVVVGIHLPIRGDVNGFALIAFLEKDACVLSDVLLKKEPATTIKVGVMEEAALKEIGNIITGNYLTVIGNTLNINVIGYIPRLSIGKSYDLIINKASELIQKFKTALCISIKLTFQQAVITGGYVLFLFESGEVMKRLEEGADTGQRFRVFKKD